MEQYKERKQQTYNNLVYSLQRIDVLIITICGAGIYVCLEAIKFYLENKMAVNLEIKIAGVVFLVSIILNFISQHYGYKSNENDYLMCDTTLKINSKKHKKKTKKELKRDILIFDISAEKYSNYTIALNTWSMIIMFIGLTILGFHFFTF